MGTDNLRRHGGQANTGGKATGLGAGRGGASPTFLIDGADGGIDAVSRALAAAKDVGDIATDVAADLFANRLYAPNGRWELLIQLRDQRWVILTRSGAQMDGWEQEGSRWAKALKRAVIAAGDESSDKRARFVLADAGKTLIEFVCYGEKYALRDLESGSPLVPKDYDKRSARQWATRFKSDRHDDEWWRKQTATKSLDRLLREMKAYLPHLRGERDGKHVSLVTFPEDLHSTDAIERIDLVVFGEKGKANARPSDVDQRLTDAISDGDPAAVSAALAAGADPHRPPGVDSDGLDFAIFCLTWGKAPLLPDKLAVVEQLLATGAGAGVPTVAARDAWWRERKRKALTKIYRDHWKIAGDEPELDLPASTAGESVLLTVEPRQFRGWSNVRQRDSVAVALEASGFVRLGEFAILQFPRMRMLVLHSSELQAFAVVNALLLQCWAELVRWHNDGSALTVGNLDLPPEAVHETPGHRKVLQPRWGVNKLVDFLRNEPPPAAGVRPVTPAEFKTCFERYYAEDLAARRKH